MTPALRLALSLVVSLLLWLPTIPAALAMHDSPETIALRYLLALIVARIGVGVVFRVVRGYAKQVLAAEAESVAESQEDDDDATFGRRQEDQAAETVTEEQQLDDALEEAHEAAVLTS